MRGVFASEAELIKHVIENFPEVTEYFRDNEIIRYCPGPKCGTNYGFQIVQKDSWNHETAYSDKLRVVATPIVYVLRCPSCKNFATWVVYQISVQGSDDYRYFRLLSLPGETSMELPELPPDPPTLRKAYREGIRGLEANNPMSATVMFRRALQVITRQILGAPSGDLKDELEWLSKNVNKLGLRLSKNFHDNGFIIRHSGNQGAHPDHDPDLADFDHEDAQAIYELFLEIVHEVFSVPAVKEEAKRRFMTRRKIWFPSPAKSAETSPSGSAAISAGGVDSGKPS